MNEAQPEGRWTSAVWPSDARRNQRHYVRFGAPTAVCGHRPKRIDGERWYTADNTDNRSCSKCVAWTEKHVPAPPAPVSS